MNLTSCEKLNRVIELIVDMSKHDPLLLLMAYDPLSDWAIPIILAADSSSTNRRVSYTV